MTDADDAQNPDPVAHFWRAAHDILAGRPVEERVAQLEEDLDRLKFRAGW